MGSMFEPVGGDVGVGGRAREVFGMGMANVVMGWVSKERILPHKKHTHNFDQDTHVPRHRKTTKMTLLVKSGTKMS